MLLGVLLASVLLTQCIWPSDIINNLRAEMTSHPKVRILRLQGKKEKEWQNSGDLLDGERRDICWQFLQQEIHVTNAKITKWTDFRIWFHSLKQTQYNQRFSVIKIRPHTDVKLLRVERRKTTYILSRGEETPRLILQNMQIFSNTHFTQHFSNINEAKHAKHIFKKEKQLPP